MIPYSRQLIDGDDIESVVGALKRDRITQGESVVEFEEALSSRFGAEFATLNSATSALLVAYMSIDLKQDDEVITTPITFVATSNMLLKLGAKPIFANVLESGNIDHKQIESLITKKTKAVVSVDFAGNPVEYEEIAKICKKHSLIFISDASHSLGATYKEAHIASLADIAIFSFHAIKPITTGEGGAIASKNREIIDRAKLLSSHGIYTKNLWEREVDFAGYNFRLSDINASLGNSQLKKLDRFIDKREEIAKIYDSEFKNLSYFKIVEIASYKKSSRHLYPILIDDRYSEKKEEIFCALLDRGVGVQVHYQPIFDFALYRDRKWIEKPQSARKFYDRELSIPMHQYMSDEEVNYVVDSIKSIFNRL